MNIKADELRNKLFETYFEEDNGILLSDLMNSLSPIVDRWKELRNLLEKNIKGFSSLFSCIHDMKYIHHNDKSYLILKVGSWRYLVVDSSNKIVLDKEAVKGTFDEYFFISNFSEQKDDLWNNGLDSLSFTKYIGDISELIEFYFSNRNYFEVPQQMVHQINIETAYTYISIDVANNIVQLGFQTPDQFLYEHLYFSGDLHPMGLQDAQEKIGLNKIGEMIERLKGIKIPWSLIPLDIYKNFSLQSNKSDDFKEVGIASYKKYKVKIPKE